MANIRGKSGETVIYFIFLGFKITADIGYSHEIKRCLLLGRKAVINLDSILKSRDITLLTKVRLVNYGFSSSHVWMWKLDYKESWVLKNWCFLTVVLEKALESPFVFKEIKPVNPTEYSLEKLMLKLKLQYFGHLMWRTDSFEQTLMLGKIEGRRRRGQQRMRLLDSITGSMDMSWASSGSWWRTGKPGVLQSTGSQRVRHNWATELNWARVNPI